MGFQHCQSTSQGCSQVIAGQVSVLTGSCDLTQLVTELSCSLQVRLDLVKLMTDGQNAKLSTGLGGCRPFGQTVAIVSNSIGLAPSSL